MVNTWRSGLLIISGAVLLSSCAHRENVKPTSWSQAWKADWNSLRGSPEQNKAHLQLEDWALPQSGEPLGKVTVSGSGFHLDEHLQHLVVFLNGENIANVASVPLKLDLKSHLKNGENDLFVGVQQPWGELIRSEGAFRWILLNYDEAKGVLKERVDGQVGAYLLIPSPEDKGNYQDDRALRIFLDPWIWGLDRSSDPWKIRYRLANINREMPAVDSGWFDRLPTGPYDLKVELVSPSGSVTSTKTLHFDVGALPLPPPKTP